MNANIIDSFLEVKLGEEDDFLKIRETLTRIGVASRKDNTLYQSCHILHKQGKFYIVHFKEMFILDGKGSNFTDEDIGRRNAIAKLLQDWGLIKIVDPEAFKKPMANMSQIKVLPYREKNQWELKSKYTVGNKR